MIFKFFILSYDCFFIVLGLRLCFIYYLLVVFIFFFINILFRKGGDL